MQLQLESDVLAICQLPADAALPAWISQEAGFVSVTRTHEELSIVCPEHWLPAEQNRQGGWRYLCFQGPIDFEEVGVLSSVLLPLAQANISVYSLSTYNTDYLLIQIKDLDDAMAALERAGHFIDA